MSSTLGESDLGVGPAVSTASDAGAEVPVVANRSALDVFVDELVASPPAYDPVPVPAPAWTWSASPSPSRWQTSFRRVPSLRRRSLVLAVALCAVVLVACGGDDAEVDGTVQAPAATGTDTPDVGDTSSSGGNPSTAGGGEAGEYTGPGYLDSPPEVCPPVDVAERVTNEDYAGLRDELDCILDHPDEVPADLVDAARDADAYAQEQLEGGTTGTTPPPEPAPDEEPTTEPAG